MKEEIALKAEEALIQIVEDISQTREFVIDQVPLVIQELLAWNFWTRLLDFCIGVLIPILLVFAIRYAWRKMHELAEAENQCCDEDEYFPFFLITFFMSIIFGMMSLVHLNLEWLQIIIAPRLWLLEYAADLVRS